MSAFDPKRTLAFLGHLVLYEPNDRCDDRPSDAAANCLTEESTDIHAAGCTAQHRHKCGEDLTSNAASNRARDGVAPPCRGSCPSTPRLRDCHRVHRLQSELSD